MVGLNLNFESTHKLVMNLNLISVFAKSMNLNVLIKHSMNSIFSNQTYTVKLRLGVEMKELVSVKKINVKYGRNLWRGL